MRVDSTGVNARRSDKLQAVMRTLLADPLLTVSVEEARGLVRYQRTRLPLPSLEEMRALHERMAEALRGLPLKELKLLVDVRDAPPRNDPAFESEVTRILNSIISKFAAHAVLVRSAVGLLQVQRLERERNASGAAVFANEEAALRHLKV
jgi:hypothetical protein